MTPDLDMELGQGWARVRPEIAEVAEAVLSPEELDVFKAKASDYGRRRGSSVLGITEDAYRYRWEQAKKKVLAELERRERKEAA